MVGLFFAFVYALTKLSLKSSAVYIFHIRLLILIQLVMNFFIAVLSYKHFCDYRVIQLNKYIPISACIYACTRI